MKNKKQRPIRPIMLAALVAALYLVEVALILLRVTPTVLTFPSASLLFLFANLAVAAYVGATLVDSGLDKVIVNGAAITFMGPFIISVATVISMLYVHTPILGALVINNTQALVLLVYLTSVVVLAGIIVAMASAIIKRRVRFSSLQKTP